MIGNGYNFLYSLCLFALFFPHKLYRFNTLLTIILILGNWYVYLIFSRVLWISGCPCNRCLYIFRISYSCSSVGIYNLSLFFFFAVYYIFVSINADRCYYLFILLCWQSSFIGNNLFSSV